MADKQSKAIVVKKDLPEFSGKDSAYTVRFRVASKDKNRVSAWSKYQAVSVIGSPATVPTALASSFSDVSPNNSTVSIIWTPPTTLKSDTYDVFVRWYNTATPLGDWEFHSNVPTSAFSTIFSKTGANHVNIAVQVPAYPKARYSVATLFETGNLGPFVVA